MAWVWVVVAAAMGGLAMLAVFAVVLWRKARALADALAVLVAQLETAARLVDGVGTRTS